MVSNMGRGDERKVELDDTVLQWPKNFPKRTDSGPAIRFRCTAYVKLRTIAMTTTSSLNIVSTSVIDPWIDLDPYNPFKATWLKPKRKPSTNDPSEVSVPSE